MTRQEYNQSLLNEAAGTKKNEDKEENTEIVNLLKQLEQSKEEAREWHRQCKEATEECQNKIDEDSNATKPEITPGGERFNMYWSDTQTILPAIYSKTPIVISKKRLDADDKLANTGSIIDERLGQYLVDFQPFDQVMEACCLEFANCNRTSARVFFSARVAKENVRIAVIQSPEQIFITQDGQPADPTQIQQDEQGLFILREQETITEEKVILRAISWCDILLAPGARTEEESWFKAFRIPYSKEEAEEKFGKEKLTYLKPVEYYGDKNKKKSTNHYEVWEVWDKRTKTVKWLSESCKHEYLKVEQDIYELDGFFPDTPILINSKPKDSLYPTTEYEQTKDCYQKLHKLYRRINRMIDAIRPRFFYDSAVDNLDTLVEKALDGMGIPLNNFADLNAKGGIGNVIQFFPLEQYVKALQQLRAEFQSQKEDLYALRGIPDVVRGVSDPRDLATSQMIKGKWASLRFSRKQKGFQAFVRDCIQLMVDLALEKFSTQTIMDIVGYEFLDPEDKARFLPALKMLKNDKQRNIRVDIETDSTILLNEDEDKANRLELLEKVGGYISQTARAIKEEPAVAPAMMSILMHTVRGYRQGKQAEDEIQQSFQKLLDQLSQPQDPPPNVDLLRAENERLRIEGDQRIKEGELKVNQFEAAVKYQESKFNQQIETLNYQLERQSKNMEMYEKLIEEQRLQLQNVILPEQSGMYLRQQNTQSHQVLELLGVVKTLLEENQKPKSVEINRDMFGNTKIKVLKDLTQLSQ